ncbi:hypothetical protein K503DRAFT_800695 [Rhizopogon vinicolor AM-OR11-026]|uniref:ATP synthase subunit J, mitochondrial n=1 Tax=Rhizopogon vinicolor AM-OR11-026 TaxID=1314800 RepID=A0A1B7MZT9_9AGAM|nr:hypothetical protein K503DRAFT_800695 [Rhizopogon vinicolor AM-OR11-026]
MRVVCSVPGFVLARCSPHSSSVLFQPFHSHPWLFSVFASGPLLHVLRPMAPFLAASAITFYLASKMQDMGVRSETYAKDPKNPYAAKIAKEAHH